MKNSTLLGQLLARVAETRDQIASAWPYQAEADSGVWETVDDGDWCGGHYTECLRLKGVLEAKPELIDEARERTEMLRPKLEKDDQFRGHRFYYSAARLYAHSGEQRYRTLALAAAYCMRAMAIPQNGAMPIGMEVQVRSTTLASRRIVAIDNVHPNLRLDFWAWAETQDPIFRAGAMAMLDIAIRDFLRPDGSTVEFIEYHQSQDRVLREFTLLGVHDASCWSRGQAWAIAGFLRGWSEFGETRYRDAARSCFDYWLQRCGHQPPPWDFADPSGPVDTSASAIVIEQLARMAVCYPQTQVGEFSQHLQPMIEGLIEHLRPTGRLINGCFNKPKNYATNSELIWGSAYLLMALSYLQERRVWC